MIGTIWFKLGVLAGSFLLGCMVQGWRLEAAHLQTVQDLTNSYHKLEIAVGHQNTKVVIGATQLQLARSAQLEAETLLKKTKISLEFNHKQVKEFQASSCKDILIKLQEVSR